MKNTPQNRKVANKTTTKSKSVAVSDVRGEKHFRKLVEHNEQPVVIDFWAPWCQPCKRQGPIVDAAAKEYAGRVTFLKVNTEANASLAREFRISSIPTLLVLDQGEVVDARIGLTSRAQLDTLLRRVLDKHEGVTFVDKVKRLFKTESSTAAG